MNLESQLKRILEIDEIIRSGNSGRPRLLAKKLKLSESQLFKVLSIMKKMGSPIMFSKERQTYYYAFPGKFLFGYIPDEKG